MKKIIALLICLVSAQFLEGKNFILISAPGSGKGTFSQYLMQRNNHVQINLGDIFREEIRKQTVFGSQIKHFVDNGLMVPDDIKCPIIFDRLLKITLDGKNFILDGFPSSINSFNQTYDFLSQHNLIDTICCIQFVANDKTCCNRIAGRQHCPQCCKTYNTATMMPKIENICDDCGTQLTQRKDAIPEVIKRRLNTFHTDIEPLIDLAKEKGYKIHRIDAECPPEDLPAIYEKLIAEA